MKIPKAERLPSGSWRVRLQIDKRSVSIIRPTKKEAEREAALVKARAKEAITTDRTVTEAIDAYISSREGECSPATIRGYRMIQKHRFQPIMHKRIRNMTREQWQQAIDDERGLCAPKTLQNAWRFLSSVILMETNQKFKVTLPQVIPKDLPWLEPEQILPFCNAIKGTKYEVAALLALSSLRRSEILAVTWEDIDLERGCIFVRGAVVAGPESSRMVSKPENKNASSRRLIPFILPPLREALEKLERTDGPIVTVPVQTLHTGIDRICRDLGFPEVGFHGLRRSFLSLAYHIGIPQETALRIGGWSNDEVARKVYLKISEKDFLNKGSEYSSFFSPQKVVTKIVMSDTNIVAALEEK